MLEERLKFIRQQIREAEQKYNKPPGSVKLLAASKARTVEEIAAVAACGQNAFGENYVQEAIPKIKALQHLSLEWHFIGKIQSNKTKLLAQYFSWAQSVARVDIAESLNKYRQGNLVPLNVCIEVNLSDEVSKSGVQLAEVLPLAKAIVKLPNLKLRGLMAIPAPSKDFAHQFATFSILARKFSELNSYGFGLDTQSIGMSDDFTAAIAAGSTMVRIGTAIFGPRRDNDKKLTI